MEADNDSERQTWLTKLNLISSQIPSKACIYLLTGKEQSTGSDWVYKAGGKNAAFKRRWCVVKGNLFYYYENQQDLNPKGYWDLKDCELGRIKEKEASTRFRWKITLKEDQDKKEERILYVENEEKREKWLKLMLAAKVANLNLELKPQQFNNLTSTPSAAKKVSTATGGAGGVGGGVPPAAGEAPKRPEKGPDFDKIPPSRDMSVKPRLDDGQDFSVPMQWEGESAPEIVELISPRPYTNCYLSHRVYDDKNIEKERNAECLKSGRSVGLEEEWDEAESDWLSGGEEIDEEDGCVIM